LVGLSGAFTYATWLALAGTLPLARDVLSLLVWVAGFGAGSALFWRAVERLFGR